MYKIILASNSPRRQELLKGLDIEFTIKVLPDIDESYPEDMAKMDVAEYIAHKKSQAYQKHIADNELVITADTMVICGEEILGKPVDAADAARMLHLLSGRTHQVVTGVCLTTKNKQKKFSVITDVTFAPLTDEEIDFYIQNYKPFDKAGAYGIQEWIGYVGVRELRGSYFNVMGFPVHRIYQELKNFDH